MSFKKAQPIDFASPFDHTELMRHLTAMEDQYSFVTIGYLGTSVLDRGIPLVQLGGGRRKLLFVGGQQGAEWITSAILTKFLWEVAYAVHNNTCMGHLHYRSVFETHTILIVPMLNPDGVDYRIHGVEATNPLYDRLLEMNGGSKDFSHWQANARGVDLDRNYHTAFQSEDDHENKTPTSYRGVAPESEPEVHALCNLIRYHGDLLGVMDLHTQGREIYDQSGEQSPSRAERIAQRLARLSGYRLTRPSKTAAPIGLSDWCIRERSLPAFSLTCGGNETPLPSRALPHLYAELREALFTFPILL